MITLQELNDQYAQVKIGGKIRFFDGIDFLSKDDFTTVLGGQLIKTGKETIPAAKKWLNWPGRKTYKGITFYPGEVSSDILNLWKGWKFHPRQGEWGLFREHIEKNVCAGNGECINWLLDWVADVFQEPHKKKGTALVIYGDKGSGKSIFAETIGHLMKRGEFITLSNSDQATSRFNQLYERCLLLCADEAIFAGDKKIQGTIKNLITALYIWIERKGLEGYNAPNFTRFIFTTNEGWAISASKDERRYLVLKIDNGWQQKEKKFAAMLQQMEDGGYQAMMYDLMHRQITSDLRNPPKTEFLKEQIECTLPPVESFLKYWVGNHSGDGEWENVLDAGVNKNTLFAEYNEFIRSIRGGGRTPSAFWREVKKLWTFNEHRVGGYRKIFLISW